MSTRGYFGIGVEGLSKAMNLGTLFRSANAFGASFIFTIDAAYSRATEASDTSHAIRQVPYYRFERGEDLLLPRGCALVGVEFLDDALDLPSFRHPLDAAYVLGPERGELSPATLERCDYIIKIPTSFCVNVGTAGAIVMYDRLLSQGRFAERPVTPHAEAKAVPPHVRGQPRNRTGTGNPDSE